MAVVFVRSHTKDKNVLDNIVGYVCQHAPHADIFVNFPPLSVTNDETTLIISAGQHKRTFGVEQVVEHITEYGSVYLVATECEMDMNHIELLSDLMLVTYKEGKMWIINEDRFMDEADGERSVMVMAGFRIGDTPLYTLDFNSSFVRNACQKNGSIIPVVGSWKSKIFQTEFTGIEETIGNYAVFFKNDLAIVDLFHPDLKEYVPQLMKTISVRGSMPNNFDTEGRLALHLDKVGKKGFIQISLPAGEYFRDEPLFHEYMMFRV